MTDEAPTKRKPGRPRTKSVEGGDRVIGVSPHEGSGSWRIVWCQGGRKRTTYRPTEVKAQEWAAKKQLELTGPYRPPATVASVPRGQGKSRDDWARILWGLAGNIVRAPDDDNAQRAAKAVAALASAAAKFVDMADVMARIDALESAVSVSRKAHAHGQHEVKDADRPEQGREAAAPGAVFQ